VAPTATKSTDEVDIDVGILYVAPLGTAEPTSSTSVLDAAWREVGYTEDGSKFTTAITVQDVEVAELLDPVATKTTKRVAKMSFAMAQMSRRNLLLALNQGADGANNTTAVEPVSPASEVRVMVLWQSEQTGADQRRILGRRAYNTGNLEIAAAKAPQKRLMAVDFTLEKPSAAQAFAFFPSNSGEI
jgi:hypothetical protein